MSFMPLSRKRSRKTNCSLDEEGRGGHCCKTGKKVFFLINPLWKSRIIFWAKKNNNFFSFSRNLLKLMAEVGFHQF